MKDRLKNIRDNLTEIEELLDVQITNINNVISSISDTPSEPEPPELPLISNLQVNINNQYAYLTWDNNSEKDIDIQYVHKESGNIISIWDMIMNTEFEPTPLNIGDEDYRIYLGKEGKWNFTVVTGEWDYDNNLFVVEGSSDTVTVNFEQDSTDPLPEKLNISTAFWSSNYVPDDNELKKLMTSGISKSPNRETLEQIVDDGKKVIPLFAGFKTSHSDYELRKRVGWYTQTFERIGWENIDYIILTDEPYLKGFSKNQVEVILDEARKEYKAPVTFTFTRGAVMREEFPQLDIAIVNYYTFYEKNAPNGYVQIHDYESFKELFDKTFDTLKEKIPNTKIIITAQVFASKEGGNYWRIPEPETAEWYMKAISERDDVIGLTFWGWESDKWIGFSELPELQEAWINALKKWVNYDDEGDVPDSEPEPDKTSKKITVVENSKNVLNTPVPNGLVRFNGKYRLFFFERNDKEMLYSESDDLEIWTDYKKAGFATDSGTNIVQDANGNVYAYSGEGEELYIYDLKGSNLNRLENKRKAYEWRIDGKLVISIIDGKWYATGRVRGNSPKDEGGWGDDLPNYPELSELPFIKQEYDKHLPSYRNPDDYLKDRRGISLHTSDDGKDWSNGKIIADPKEYDEKPFRGWMVDGANGIGDFYSSTMIDEKRIIVKAYMKEKDRVIDRWDYDPDMRIERRFRFTGETILIPAIIENGKVKFTSTESIIPREYHERKTPDGVEYATCRECVDIGQLNNGNEIIEKDGYVYMTYGYRDDVHYEGRGFDYHTGVYLYRVPKEEFYNLFK